jgi:hypothetical protein
VIQQVYGILSMNKVEFRTDDTGKSFLDPYGSAGVYVDFRDWADGQTLVNLHAFVLDQVDVADELMGALRTLASMADDLDDKLRTAIGTGRSAQESWDEAHDQAQTPTGTGPVVSA